MLSCFCFFFLICLFVVVVVSLFVYRFFVKPWSASAIFDAIKNIDCMTA